MGMKLNFSQVQTRSFEPLPNGWYHVAITDLDPRQSRNAQAKYPGAWYLAAEMTVQSGEYEGRKLWTNIMMIPTALFTLKGICDAAGIDLDDMEFDGDDMVEQTENACHHFVEVLEGAEFMAKSRKVRKMDADRSSNDPDDFRNEVNAFKTIGADGTGGAAATRNNSLLP